MITGPSKSVLVLTSQITEPGPEANKWAAQVSVHNNKTGEEQWFPLPENFWNPETGLRTALRYGMELIEGKLDGLAV